jgi:hypothetical protein
LVEALARGVARFSKKCGEIGLGRFGH